MLTNIESDNLSQLAFDFLVHTITGNHSEFVNPTVYNRRMHGYTSGIHFDKDVKDRDFYRYSGYSFDMKMTQLRTQYFSPKVQKQHQVLKSMIRKLQPRQARGLITFSEPMFDESTKLKCLDSMYVYKQTMTSYEVMLILRSSEVFPKLFMDFVFIHELLSDYTEERVECNLFSVLLSSSFINGQQAPAIAMFLRRYGITTWNDAFKQALIQWQRKYEDPACIDKLTMQSIKRIITRNHKLLAEEGLDLDILIHGR